MIVPLLLSSRLFDENDESVTGANDNAGANLLDNNNSAKAGDNVDDNNADENFASLGGDDLPLLFI